MITRIGFASATAGVFRLGPATLKPNPALRQLRVVRAVAALILVTLGGCFSLPQPKAPQLDLPSAPEPALAGVAVASDWWRVFGDPVLDALQTEAQAHNADLRLAAARIEEARAGLALVRGEQYPTLGASAGASRNRATEVGSFPMPSPINNSFEIGLAAGYEVDLWGRYRAATAAARADLLATEYAREVVRISLTATVTKAYFGLRALDARTELARETLANRRQMLELEKQRFAVGEISAYEVRQAEAEVAATESAVADLARQGRLLEQSLAVLLGRQPRALVEDLLPRGHALSVLVLPPEVPPGLPSDLLHRRPDIRQAEQAMVAAGARIAEARAALYPNLSLTANLGSESRALSDLFSGPATVWGLAAGVAQSLFNAGRSEAGIQAAAARQEQAVIAYEQAVRVAFREVLDALVTLRQSRDQAEAEARRAGALRQALTLADLRYRAGAASFLEVLDAQRSLFAAEQARLESRRAQLAAVADLNAALGGGWEAVAERARSP